jgi:hypothetical protein
LSATIAAGGMMVVSTQVSSASPRRFYVVERVQAASVNSQD